MEGGVKRTNSETEDKKMIEEKIVLEEKRYGRFPVTNGVINPIQIVLNLQ